MMAMSFAYCTHRWQCKKRYREHAETRCNNFAHPCLRHGVTVAYSRHRYNTPPQCIGIVGEIGLSVRTDHILLRQIDEI